MFYCCLKYWGINGYLFSLFAHYLCLRQPRITHYSWCHAVNEERLASSQIVENSTALNRYPNSQHPPLPRWAAVKEADLPLPPLKAVGKAIKPGVEETAFNPRARSAVLRVAERTGGEITE